MIDRLFGMKNEPREWLFQRFLGLPRPLRRVAIRGICALGRRQVARLKTPTRLIYYVTNRCNARCRHCFFAAHLNTDSSGELTLDESLERYERGVKALTACRKILGEAEKKIQLLLRTAEGELKTKPFEAEEVVEETEEEKDEDEEIPF